MNSTRQNNIKFLLNNLNNYKDIIKNDDGTFRLAHRCIHGDNDSYVKFVDTGVHNLNEFEFDHKCYRCKHCETGHPFDYCFKNNS